MPATPPPGWHALGAPAVELQLDFCLPTGQSFRWRKTADHEYTGVIGPRLVQLRQQPDDVWYRVLARGEGAPEHEDAHALADYFNLGTASLEQLSHDWSGRCARYAAVRPYFPGARMLRQDPVECLFQFICSSNNHISRIHGMVERLASDYGTPLLVQDATTLLQAHGQAPTLPSPPSPDIATATAGQPAAAAVACSGTAPAHRAAGAAPPQRQGASEPGGNSSGSSGCAPGPSGSGGSPLQGQLQLSPHPQLQPPPKAEERPEATAAAAAAAAADAASAPAAGLSYYAFPSLEQLSRATEEELRAAGFGYRAKFIVGSVRTLLSKPEGGRRWLLGLRAAPLHEAVEALTELPGIGPKVAACVALFSLDKHAAIPVDTHVWQIAVRYYRPALRGRALTPKLHGEVAQAFLERFGPYCGWAHNTLFISELANQQHRLPPGLREAGGGAGGSKRKRDGEGAAAAAAPPVSEEEGPEGGAGGGEGGAGGVDAAGRKRGAKGAVVEAGTEGAGGGQVEAGAGPGAAPRRARARRPSRKAVEAEEASEGGAEETAEAAAGAEAAAAEAGAAGARERRAAGRSGSGKRAARGRAAGGATAGA